MTHVVYGFRLKGDTEVRYVGQTKHSAAKRLGFERSLAFRRCFVDGDFSSWLVQAGVEAFDIAHCDSEADARAKEREVIQVCVAIGHRLFNRQHVPADLRWNAASRAPASNVEAAA